MANSRPCPLPNGHAPPGMTLTRPMQPEMRKLLSGRPDLLQRWLEAGRASPVGLCVVSVVVGSGLYGAAMGIWRSPLQGLFVALKFPLIVLLTTLGNALLNSMLAPLLGLRISFRQSLLAVLMSFGIAGAVLGSFSPIAAFVTWNCPPLSAEKVQTLHTYSFIMVIHVLVIAFAGTAGTLRLAQLLRALSPSNAVAWRVLVAWLGANLFLGSQLSWILRPFIGSPDLPVQFLRVTAFHGNFYEALFSSLIRVFGLNQN